MVKAPSWNQLMSRLTSRERLLLGVTTIGVAVLLLVPLVYIPLIGKIRERQATLQALRVRISDAQVLTVQLSEREKRLEEARAQYHAMQAWVSGGETMARILETLNQLADDHHLQLVTVLPPVQDAITRTDIIADIALHEVPVQLTLTGRYWHIGQFLGELSETPFIAALRSLTLRRPDAGSVRLQADLILAVYLAGEV